MMGAEKRNIVGSGLSGSTVPGSKFWVQGSGFKQRRRWPKKQPVKSKKTLKKRISNNECRMPK